MKISKRKIKRFLKQLRKQINKIQSPYLWLLATPVLFYFGGIALNAIVMGVNNGQMPVQWPGGCSAIMGDAYHICMSSETHLNFLADWIVEHSGISSPGDWFIMRSGDIWYPAWAAWAALMVKDVLEKR